MKLQLTMMIDVKPGHFSMDPLIRLGSFDLQLDVAEFFGLDVRKIRRYMYEGLPWHVADAFAVALHLHPIEVWGQEWIDQAMDQDLDPELWDLPTGPAKLGDWADREAQFVTEADVPDMAAELALEDEARIAKQAARTASTARFFEGKARAAKVERIVSYLHAQGVSSLRASRMRKSERNEVARAAGANVPSDTTWAAVVDALTPAGMKVATA